jgi:hypothetical protein
MIIMQRPWNKFKQKFIIYRDYPQFFVLSICGFKPYDTLLKIYSKGFSMSSSNNPTYFFIPFLSL